MKARLAAGMASAMIAVRSVAANRGMRRLQLAWTVGTAGDWAFLILLMVVAYEAGGAIGVGVLGLARMIPATIAGPLATLPLERFPGHQVLFAVHLVRLATAVGLALALVAGAPDAVILSLAAISAAAWAIVRPIHYALLPALARSPEELVAGNVASSMAEGVGTFVGPLAIAAVMGLTDTTAASLVVAVVFGVGAMIVIGITFDQPAEAHGGHLAVKRTIPFIGGLRVLARRRGVAMIQFAFLTQVFVRGMLLTLTVVAAIELLGMGESGVGILNAAMGLGAFAGALLGLILAGRKGLAGTFAVSLALWGLPIALIGVAPTFGLALACLFVVGVSNSLLDIAGFTMTQRGVSNAERASVFGLLAGLVGLGIAAGGMVAAVAIDRFGIQGALAIAGAILPIVAVATWPRIAQMDRATLVPESRLRLIRGVPFFRSLPLTAIERVAEALEPVRFEAGEVLMRQGDPGDRFVIVEQGQVEIRVDGRVVGHCGPGDGLGEIALVRDVPRMATATATVPTTAFAIEREFFLAAIAGPEAAAAACQMAEARLALSRSPAT